MDIRTYTLPLKLCTPSIGDSKSDMELIDSTQASKATYYRYKRELIEGELLRMQMKVEL